MVVVAGLLLALGLAAHSLCASALENDPAALGRKAADNVLGTKSGLEKISRQLLGETDTSYMMACSRYGILILADALHDKDLRDRVAKSYEPYLTGRRKPHKGHVDYNVFGIVPFELYRQTSNRAYLPLAQELADDEFQSLINNGLSSYTRFWVDDMYMVGSQSHQGPQISRPVLHPPFRLLLQAATAQRAFSPRAQRPALLGARQRMGGGVHDRTAARHACRPSAKAGRARGLSQDDAGIA